MAIKDLSATDGVSAPSGNDAWDAALDLSGVDLTEGLSPDVVDAVVDASQLEDAGSSAGAGSDGTGTPQSAPAGDDGSQAPVPDAPVVAADPAASTPAAPDVEPIPFTFDVDGKPDTIEGAMEIKGDGIYIPESAAPLVRTLFSQAKTLDAQVRTERTQRQAEAEQWNRRTTHTFKNTEGKEVTVSGLQGLEAMRVEAVSDKAALHTILGALTDPARFRELVDYVCVDRAGTTVAPDEDGNAPAGAKWWPILNQEGYAKVSREGSQTIRERAFAVRQEMAKPIEPAAPPEPTADSFAGGTISQLAEQHGLTALSADDKQFLASHFATYTRAATPEERAQFGVPRLVLPSFVELMKTVNGRTAREATIAQTAAASATKKAVVDTKVTGFNGGMKKGLAPAPVVRAAPIATPPAEGKFAPKAKTGQSGNDIWSGLYAEAQQIASG